ncbi:MAG TPA: CBS domain-containing protein [Kiloniellaceae bacterium]|nr:CBS domain-containing protein [Kiloniellaceae bacterium]
MDENADLRVRVRDVMTTPPCVIDGLARVQAAVELMREAHVSSLVIDRRHEDDEYGMLSVHDVAEQVIGRDRSLERVSVYEIMSKPVLTVDADMDIKYAIRILTRFRLNRGLVTENGEMVGIVTLRDMAIRYPGQSRSSHKKPSE